MKSGHELFKEWWEEVKFTAVPNLDAEGIAYQSFINGSIRTERLIKEEYKLFEKVCVNCGKRYGQHGDDLSCFNMTTFFEA